MAHISSSVLEIGEVSPAFREALLKTERLRIQIVLVAIGAAFLVRTLRTAIVCSPDDLRLWAITSAFIAVFGGYEWWMLRSVTRVLHSGHNLAPAAWNTNIAVETCIPGLALVLLSSGAIAEAYQPLANPAVMLYFIFIILSTLRLNPAACRISGVAAAASYLVAATYLGWALHFRAGASLLSPERAVPGFAGLFVVGGFVAGAVAGEIRKQIEAALREAEAKRQVERLEHDLDIARSIQQSLFPAETPRVDGFEIAGWNQPADQTGGDYYDWQVLPDGRFLATLADVTGHGIGPALLAALCRAYARSNFTPERDLFVAMHRLNSALFKDIGTGRFVTLVAVKCTPGSSHVELLSAGHGPLFLYWLREDRFDMMNAQGLPLGLMPDLASEPPKILELSQGDFLVLTTDGFFESTDAKGEAFGVARLQATVRASRELSPAEIISTLYKAVVEFSGRTKQDDDLTALVIKRTWTA
jgi:serine phosphatase RsbU (regulator of sigma subunit)